MSILIRRSWLGWLATALVIVATFPGYENKETGEAKIAPLSSPSLSPTVQPTVKVTPLPTDQPTVQVTPTLFVFGPLIDPGLDIKAGPEEVPLEIRIPSLKVNAPVLGVGLTAENVMDSPKGSTGDPIWSTAFWYRGGGIPGEIGTATIAGHVNDPQGQPMIFAHIEDLQPGDLIIIHLKNTTHNIRFIVDEIKVYSIKESSNPAVLRRIYGAGPVDGIGPQPAPDGLSHLTLITCAGYIVNDEFNAHTVVYASRSK